MNEGDVYRHTADELKEALEDRSREDDQATVLQLAAMSAIEYDRCCEAKAERLGVRVTALDADVARARRELGGNGEASGGAVLFPTVEPWQSRIDGAALLDALGGLLHRYVVLPKHAETVIALWILLTNLHEAVWVCPLLVSTSPEKRCGKTTLLSLLRRLCHRPLPASNITAAALFRAIEKWQPTLLIDEAGTFLKHSEELRGIINSGHTRDMAFVVRTVGDEHEPRRFSTWAPKVIAQIGNVPGTTPRA
jgi:putative DNA primase/helicase